MIVKFGRGKHYYSAAAVYRRPSGDPLAQCEFFRTWLLMRISILLLIILPSVLLGQRLTTLDTAQVVAALLSPETRNGLCFDDSAVAMSSRLGFTCEGLVYRCLIAYDLEESIRARLRNKQLEYATSLNSCGGD